MIMISGSRFMISARCAAHVRWLRKRPAAPHDVPVEQSHFGVCDPYSPIAPEPIIGITAQVPPSTAQESQHESHARKCPPLPRQVKSDRCHATPATTGRYIRIGERNRPIADHLAGEARDDDGGQTEGHDPADNLDQTTAR